MTLVLLILKDSESEERREYIASLIANSLSREEIEFQESKHLLRILGEINDIEVIWLRFYLDPMRGGDEDFRNKHNGILSPVSASMGMPQSAHDKNALQKSYKDHLAQLGLLRKHYKVDRLSKLPEYDYNGAMKVQRHSITTLGRLLIKEIGLLPDPD